MRVSTYEIILPLEENSLLINGLYSAFDIVSKEDAEKITTGNLADFSAEIKERLLLRGHITNKSETAEVADMKLLSRIYKMTYGRIGIGAVIMPAYDCNFRYPYCYEQHRLSKGQNWLSYTMTNEMIDEFFSVLRNYKISLRVNIGRENIIHGMKDLIDDLKAHGFLDKENFIYYFKATNDDLNPKNNVTDSEIVRELEKIGFTTKEICKVHGEYGKDFANLTRVFKKEAYGSFSPIYCGSEQEMILINPLGNLYTCWDFVGKDDKAIGFVDKSAKWRTRTVDLMEKCVKCPYCFIICQGGCAARAEFKYGNCFREDCGESKEFFNLTAAKLGNEHWKNHHESELSLSLLEPLSKLTEKERETFMTSKS